MYFPTLTVIIRCVLKRGEPFYPQAYLEDCYLEDCIDFIKEEN